ncbi:hypothetical protein F8S13_21930 [Chloroflexia bacterium SDU3-3]|nr:hypothetical protein F8S13_21930 [Chloroflexia bacterium SDU3-3]
MVPSPTPRYDRIVSLVILVVLGMAVIFAIDVNPAIFRVWLGGDFPVITVSWLLIAALVLITSTGADVFIRSHPAMQSRKLPTLRLGRLALEVAPAFWILPSMSIVASFAFFRLFSESLQTLAFILALSAVGVLVFGSLVAQHYALDRVVENRTRAQLALQVIVYTLGYACFCAIYYARLRWLYSGALVGGAAAMLSYALLQWSAPRAGHFLLALTVGVVLGESLWALNYWAAPFLLGGAMLLVIFYIVCGLLQHHLQQSLTRQVMVEYAAIGTIMFAGVVVVTFR